MKSQVKIELLKKKELQYYLSFAQLNNINRFFLILNWQKEWNLIWNEIKINKIYNLN